MLGLGLYATHILKLRYANLLLFSIFEHRPVSDSVNVPPHLAQEEKKSLKSKAGKAQVKFTLILLTNFHSGMPSSLCHLVS